LPSRSVAGSIAGLCDRRRDEEGERKDQQGGMSFDRNRLRASKTLPRHAWRGGDAASPPRPPGAGTLRWHPALAPCAGTRRWGSEPSPRGLRWQDDRRSQLVTGPRMLRSATDPRLSSQIVGAEPETGISRPALIRGPRAGQLRVSALVGRRRRCVHFAQLIQERLPCRLYLIAVG
jgi:hypothetical protein